MLTSAGRLLRLGVLDLPAIPPSANESNLQGGVPLSELCRSTPASARSRCARSRPTGPGLALGTRHGVVKRVNPEVLGRDEWDVIRLADGDEVVGAVELRTGEEELVLRDVRRELLHFPAIRRPSARPFRRWHGRHRVHRRRVVWFGALEPRRTTKVRWSSRRRVSTAGPGTGTARSR